MVHEYVFGKDTGGNVRHFQGIYAEPQNTYYPLAAGTEGR